MRINTLISDKVVVVTGGSRGIGKMVCTTLVIQKARLASVYISSRSGKDCDTTAAELNATGPGTCIALPANLATPEGVEFLVAELTKREKAVHVLVNNAGAVWGAKIEAYPDAAFSKVLNLNLQSVFSLTQKLLPLLRAAAASSKVKTAFTDPSRIINIGSVEGLGVPAHETYAYSASKAALHHLSRHLAGRLGPDGITSNTIACGPFPSKMMAATLEKMEDAFNDMIPLGRVGKPEDVAGTALYLASPAGSWVSGATLTLDGGFLVSMSKL
ncbi:NAD-P-binding protein [Cylindrobasidium torrendii FP15055 ss-10]|uniref:NAD-P-binding protein n=1 Tax=Cylindrobasidium torrendii FP15055 ss-10 TaxID=1314674 RepID=A0A0D7BIU9_9AGAR|nr:NAD-P-binding protein [Cylindrobasidium torrendii FP15055 ss-10]